MRGAGNVAPEVDDLRSIIMTPPDPRTSPDVAWSDRDLAADPHQAADKAIRVRRMFSSIARTYDLNNRLHSFGRDVAWRRNAVRLAGVERTDDVLDVACGTGDLTLAFYRAGARRVVGLDFADRMLDLARTKAARRVGRADPGRMLIFEQGDAMALPHPDGSFDVVSIAFGLRNVEDPATALREFRRVLRPGGRLVVLEFSTPKNRLLRFANDIYTKHIMPLTASIIARDRSGAYRYLPRSVETFPEGQAMAGVIRDAGFDSVEQHPQTFGVCTIHVARAPAR